MEKKINLPESWLHHLSGEFELDYMRQLKSFLTDELKGGKTIYPHGSEIFSAFNLTPFDKVKVVILGQDPYHGPGQAHGLSFSVKPGVRIPPSLVNIYRELKDDLGVTPPTHGHLASWGKEGVLLLNAVLTVEARRASSHQGKGWELFTDRVVQVLNRECRDLVFILWGRHAQKKGSYIDEKRHKVLKAGHPSPFSAHRSFFGCRHFSATNDYLKSVGKDSVNWQVQ